MRSLTGSGARSDVFVVFGATGDLAGKMLFPALYALVKSGELDVPVVGVARQKWSAAQLRRHASSCIREAGPVDDPRALTRLLIDSWRWEGVPWYLRFRLSPNSAVALAARVKRTGRQFVGEHRELFLLDEQPAGQPPYARLPGDAVGGDGARFTREYVVEAAWAVVDPVLRRHRPAIRYRRGSWGPRASDALIAPDGAWMDTGTCDAARVLS